MNPITEGRHELVEALDAAVDCKVHHTAPKVPTPPCVAVTAAAPWMTPETVGGNLRVKVAWRLMVVVRPGQEYVDALEDLIAQILPALPRGVTCTAVGPPQLLDTGQGDVQVAELTLTARISEE